MKEQYLGDSYDAVKRMWKSILIQPKWNAPLFAEQRFIDVDIQENYTLLTGIEMLPAINPPHQYSILNDPDTGIRLPGEENQNEGRSHISIDSIIRQLQIEQVKCVVTFDQSDYRNHDADRKSQRKIKLSTIKSCRMFGFYYVSHAPFLFSTKSDFDNLQLKKCLVDSGIPEWRLEN